MKPKNPKDERSQENEPKPRDETREAPDRSAAPPIEREHETQPGALEEEEERREREGR